MSGRKSGIQIVQIKVFSRQGLIDQVCGKFWVGIRAGFGVVVLSHGLNLQTANMEVIWDGEISIPSEDSSARGLSLSLSSDLQVPPSHNGKQIDELDRREKKVAREEISETDLTSHPQQRNLAFLTPTE